MNLPTLYSRTATGAIQEWTIRVINNQYQTISGQINGKLTVSDWTVCEGKNLGRANETTPSEQARAEAMAKWNKKRDKGYFENIKHVDQQLFVEPMLAKVWDDYKDKVTFPVYSQPKLDGIRCVATPQGLFSRNGKPFVGVPHIYEKIQRDIWSQDPNVILDGELYNHNFKDDFNEICSIVKKSKPTHADIAYAKQNIEYHIYDIVDTSKTYKERFVYLRKLVGTIFHIRPLKTVWTDKIASHDDLDKKYAEYMDAGYEGQIVRLDAPYENKRSKSLLKRKEFQDAEFEIISVNEGIGNRAGVAGNMTLRDAQGKIFNSNIKADFGLLGQYLLDGPKLVGKMATVKYFNLTPDGIPRFPFVISVNRGEYE